MSAVALVCLTGSLMLGQIDEKILVNAPPIVVKDSPSFGLGRLTRKNVLIYDHINWGFNFHRPENRGAWGDPKLDLSRMPTAYYHPHGPFGVAVSRYDWLPGTHNTYHADARLPACLVGLGGGPLTQLTALWTEPPIAVLGLGVGTAAAYARPYQVMHFVERDPAKIALTQPAADRPPYFRFLTDARDRGAMITVDQGEHRKTFAKRGGERFYRLILIETIRDGKHERLDEAILTREAMQMLMGKLADGGILCFHTSHRYLMSERAIASSAADLGYASRTGRDVGDWQGGPGHFTSTWIMVARRPADLAHLKQPPGYTAYKWAPRGRPYWFAERTDDRLVWRDGASHPHRGLWRKTPFFGEVESWLYKAEQILYRNIRPGLVSRFTTPLHERLHDLDAAVAKMLNR